MTVALVTDSNAQVPRALIDRFEISVVPLTVVIDGEEYLEGVDITTEDFYARLALGASVSTAAPSPGEVLLAYERAASNGADSILSIHIGSNTSATLNAVGIASRMSALPVTIVDTGTASFGVGCCVWAAGECLASGGTIEAARVEAERVAQSVGNVFVVGALDLARSGGRLAADVTGADATVLALEAGQMRPVARVRARDAAVESMAGYVEQEAGGRAQRVGIGDACNDALARQLIERLHRGPAVGDLVRYEVGPSVGAHTGPGTVGAVFFPM
jgi:DegV family protein with EDD domain